MALRTAIILALTLLTLWATAAIYFDLRSSALAALYLAAVVLTLWRTRANHRSLALWATSLALIVGWWLSLVPTNDRSWQPDVAELATAEISGNTVTIRNVRNFDYRTETDYTPRWETRTIDLSQIRGVDLFSANWGAPLITHAIVSFRFGNGTEHDTFLALSIEARKTVDQQYSAIRGLFRQYTLIHVMADERDVIRLRTNYRQGETVRLYHTNLNPNDSRDLFLQSLQWLARQREQPEWYNALTDNCSSRFTGYLSRRQIGGVHWWDPRVVLNGLAEQLLYDQGDLATAGLSFEQLQQAAQINEAAKASDHDPAFSINIRKGRPGF